MKKILTLLLVILCSFMLIGCGNNETTQKEDSKTKEEVKENKGKRLICEQPQYSDVVEGTYTVTITYDKNDKATEIKMITDYALKYDIYKTYGDDDTKDQKMQQLVTETKNQLIEDYKAYKIDISATYEKNRYIITSVSKDETLLNDLEGIEKDKEDFESGEDSFYCQVEEIK